MSNLLLARGRDRLETMIDLEAELEDEDDLLLARGRDRLETESLTSVGNDKRISYSLGDAIDWKRDSQYIRVA